MKQEKDDLIPRAGGAGVSEDAKTGGSEIDSQMAVEEQALHKWEAADEITVTFFEDEYARTQRAEVLTLPALRDLILATTAPTKGKLRWLKLAEFSRTKNANNCLRYDANVQSISGAELDYDGDVMSFDEGRDRLAAACILAVIYTSANHTPAKPRWRVLLPASRNDLPPEERRKLAARANGVLGGVCTTESFTLSQAFYYGSVNSNPDHRAEIIEGDFIDLRDDLDASAIGPPSKPEASTEEIEQAFDIPRTGEIDATVEAVLAEPPVIGTRSTRFAYAAKLAVEKGMTAADFEAACREYRDGPAGKYLIKRSDLHKQILKIWTPHAAHTAKQDALAPQLTALAGPAAKNGGPEALAGEATNRDAPKRYENGIRLVAFDDIKLGTQRRGLVKGLIPREGLVVIWGPPKCGKTFWTFDLTMHIALGWEYRGRRVQQASVVYCVFEGQSGIEARKEAFSQRFLVEDDSPVPFWFEPATIDLIKDHRKLIAVIQKTLGENPPGVVVLDTLNRSLVGSESNDEDMGEYIHAADAIREAFNCVVIIVHHCGIDGTRPRGHTSLTGSADAQIATKRDAAHNIVALVEWMKDGPEGDIIVSALEVVTVGQDEDGEDITSCVVVPVSDAEAKRAPQSDWPQKLKPVRKSIIEALNKHGASHQIGGQGAKVCAVAIKLAREIHKKRYVSTGDGDRDDAERNAWKRHLNEALKADLIRTERCNDEDVVWLTEPFVLLKT